MKVQKTAVTKFNISDVDRLDPINVFCEDLEPRKGKITIECYGQSWSAYWGGMGNRSIMEFFNCSNNAYLIGCLSPNLQSRVNDYDDLVGWIKREILKQRRERQIENITARGLWNKIDFIGRNEKEFLNTVEGSNIVQELFGFEWWQKLPEIENSEYRYLSRIIDAVKDAFKLEIKEGES